MSTVPHVCLLLAFALIYVPRGIVIAEQRKHPEGLDLAHPRLQQARLTGLSARAHGAHMNGFEAFSPFAVAVLACELRHVDEARIAILSVAFVVLRSVYVALYLGNIPAVRGLIWIAGVLSVVALFVSAIA